MNKYVYKDHGEAKIKRKRSCNQRQNKERKQ